MTVDEPGDPLKLQVGQKSLQTVYKNKVLAHFSTSLNPELHTEVGNIVINP